MTHVLIRLTRLVAAVLFIVMTESCARHSE
jgi:hypothetical protein